MQMITLPAAPVKADAPADPFDAFDGFTWELGPDPIDPADEAWWAEQTRESGPDWDAMAEEAAEMDAYEMGILPL